MEFGEWHVVLIFKEWGCALLSTPLSLDLIYGKL